jgi:hypothetical protein
MTKDSLDIKLVNLKTFAGHDSMQGINADIVYRGNKIAHVYDDARGGCFEYSILGNFQTDVYKKNRDLLQELESKIAELPIEKNDLGYNIIPNIDGIISNLVSKKQMSKDQNKGLLIKTAWGYDILGGKTTLLHIIKNYRNGLETIQKWYDDEKEKGSEILNKDYLSTLGIKI